MPTAPQLFDMPVPQSQPNRHGEPHPVINLRDPNKRGSICHTPANSQEDVFTMQLVSVTISAYDPVSFWNHMKLMAVANGDLECTEQISVPMPAGGIKPMNNTIGALPVIRNNRTVTS